MPDQDGTIYRRRSRTTKNLPYREREQPRIDGMLHPASYLWVIDNQFKPGCAPENLVKRFGLACKAWDTIPKVLIAGNDMALGPSDMSHERFRKLVSERGRR